MGWTVWGLVLLMMLTLSLVGRLGRRFYGCDFGMVLLRWEPG